MRKIPAALLFGLLMFQMQSATAQQSDPTPLKVYAKDGISVKSYDYKAFEYFLSRKNDTTYVVNFWATWCKPCVTELPEFERFNRAYGKGPVKVILVSLDFKEDLHSRLIPFLQKNRYSSEVILLDETNGNDFIDQICPQWSGAIPATIITSNNKQKFVFFEKKVSFDLLEEELKR